MVQDRKSHKKASSTRAQKSNKLNAFLDKEIKIYKRRKRKSP